MGKPKAIASCILAAAVGLIGPLGCGVEFTAGAGGQAASGQGGSAGSGGATSSGTAGAAPNGTACAAGAECLSGQCTENVCCDTACSGDCESCRDSHTGAGDGTCAPIAAGDKKNEACSTSAAMCNGAGACLECGVSPLTSAGAANSISCPNGDTPCPSHIQCPPDKPCNVTCTGIQSCQNALISCPPEADCSVQCSGSGSCQGAQIVCPELHSCSVVCGGDGGQRHCNDLLVECPIAGTCSISCLADNANTCQGALLHCGYNSCSAAQCLGAEQPTFDAPAEGTNPKPAPPNSSPPCPIGGCPPTT